MLGTSRRIRTSTWRKMNFLDFGLSCVENFSINHWGVNWKSLEICGGDHSFMFAQHKETFFSFYFWYLGDLILIFYVFFFKQKNRCERVCSALKSKGVIFGHWTLSWFVFYRRLSPQFQFSLSAAALRMFLYGVKHWDRYRWVTADRENWNWAERRR